MRIIFSLILCTSMNFLFLPMCFALEELNLIGQELNCDNPITKDDGYCGDSTVQEALLEECDDGNKEFGDGCDKNCHLEIKCKFDSECPSDYCGFSGFCDPINL